ncbi:hypothetical protein C8R48DRAFT_773560 [Suillus tomentosus]|nr:hypothetical protein C8R48DRAFT_773560 [Suillus tomentosus]
MSLDSDWDSRSMDSRPSDFNDGAEAILMNASIEIEIPTGDDQSRGSTPESHKDCHEYRAYGQGAPVYSCGCYRYREMERYKVLKLSPPDLEQALESGDGDFEDVDGLGLKRKIRNENDTVHSDITNVRAASGPATKLPPSKRRNLGRQSESFKGELTQSLGKIAHEFVVLGGALVGIKEVLDKQSTILLAICEALPSVTDREGNSGC